MAKHLHRSHNLPSEEGIVYDVVVGEKVARGAATEFKDGPLNGLTKIIFGAMDGWFEEDEEIFVHPRDPYKVISFTICFLTFLHM